jgi:hypothetical protein
MSSISKQGTATTQPGGTSTMTVPMDKVAMRAYDKWCQGGCQHGCDQTNWFEAEAEIRREMMAGAKPAAPAAPASKPATPAQPARR